MDTTIKSKIFNVKDFSEYDAYEDTTVEHDRYDVEHTHKEIELSINRELAYILNTLMKGRYLNCVSIMMHPDINTYTNQEDIDVVIDDILEEFCNPSNFIITFVPKELHDLGQDSESVYISELFEYRGFRSIDGMLEDGKYISIYMNNNTAQLFDTHMERMEPDYGI